MLRTSKMLARLRLGIFKLYFLFFSLPAMNVGIFPNHFIPFLLNDWYVPVSELVKEVRWCHRNSKSVSNPPKHMKHHSDNDWWMELLINKSMMDVTQEQVPAQGYWRWGTEGCDSHADQIIKSKFCSDSRTSMKLRNYLFALWNFIFFWNCSYQMKQCFAKMCPRLWSQFQCSHSDRWVVPLTVRL